MATIKVRQDGPLLVDGDEVMVVDSEGRPYSIDRRPFVLCRCGASEARPFCDGSHRRIGFTSKEPASE